MFKPHCQDSTFKSQASSSLVSSIYPLSSSHNSLPLSHLYPLSTFKLSTISQALKLSTISTLSQTLSTFKALYHLSRSQALYHLYPLSLPLYHLYPLPSSLPSLIASPPSLPSLKLSSSNISTFSQALYHLYPLSNSLLSHPLILSSLIIMPPKHEAFAEHTVENEKPPGSSGTWSGSASIAGRSIKVVSRGFSHISLSKGGKLHYARGSRKT